MTTIDKIKPVMVTGATGYVAGVLVKLLLEEGLTVHAPVRDPENREKLKYLDGVAQNAPGTIKYSKADLLAKGSYDEAMNGCELVFHTASPFTSTVKDPQKELVEPALEGTKNVLNSVNKTDSVKRVVLTSSCVAIVGDSKDLLALPNGTATEAHWNTTSNLKHMPYNYSKVMAEKAAWKICDAQDRWDLVTINPSFVLGPGLNPFGTSDSFNIIKQMGDGTMKSGVPGYEIGVVDVKDVAMAHYKAGITPEAHGRYICSTVTKSFLEMATILRNHFGDAYPFPQKEAPKFMLWLLAPFLNMTRQFVSRSIGYPWKVDNSKSIKELGMVYAKPETFIPAFFRQMVDNGVFENK